MNPSFPLRIDLEDAIIVLPWWHEKDSAGERTAEAYAKERDWEVGGEQGVHVLWVESLGRIPGGSRIPEVWRTFHIYLQKLIFNKTEFIKVIIYNSCVRHRQIQK